MGGRERSTLDGSDGAFDVTNVSVGCDGIETDGEESILDALKFGISQNLVSN